MDSARRIQLLNDELRRDFSKGRLLVRSGVAALGAIVVGRLLDRVATYDSFPADDDPHDFGILEADGQVFYWKIDYYDLAMDMHSPDPCDPTGTERVLTLMMSAD